jgi:hypothetical protein
VIFERGIGGLFMYDRIKGVLQALYLIAAGKMHLGGGQVSFKLQQHAFSLEKVVYLPVFISTFRCLPKKSRVNKNKCIMFEVKDQVPLPIFFHVP